MLSKRLKAVASFVKYEDKVIDIGCDHAYLPIYLIEHNLCQKVMACDIHSKALEIAEKNINQHQMQDKISIFLSDGLETISIEMDTAILSGMGTYTILKILAHPKALHLKKCIVQSNNDLYLLRKKMHSYGFYLQEEKVVFEKGHYYVIGLYTRNFRSLSLLEAHFGIYSEEYTKYYHYMKKQFYSLYKKLSIKHMKTKSKLLFKIFLLKKYL